MARDSGGDLGSRAAEVDPDRRVLKMLGARGSHVAANSVVNQRKVCRSK